MGSKALHHGGILREGRLKLGLWTPTHRSMLTEHLTTCLLQEDTNVEVKHTKLYPEKPTGREDHVTRMYTGV